MMSMMELMTAAPKIMGEIDMAKAAFREMNGTLQALRDELQRLRADLMRANTAYDEIRATMVNVELEIMGLRGRVGEM